MAGWEQETTRFVFRLNLHDEDTVLTWNGRIHIHKQSKIDQRLLYFPYMCKTEKKKLPILRNIHGIYFRWLAEDS